MSDIVFRLLAGVLLLVLGVLAWWLLADDDARHPKRRLR